MLSILSGHKRYAHIAALRCDNVLPELLGMNKIVSEDAVRRSTKMRARFGCDGISIIARRRFSPSRGYSTSIRP
jgi:hypothetical protein